MNRFSIYLLFSGLVLSLLLTGCETVIDAKLDTGPTQLSVDGTLTDLPGPQSIRLTQTAAYLDNGTPPPAIGATVQVRNNNGRNFSFTDPDNDGYYVWQPTGKDTLGRIGQTYNLNITFQGETYRATSRMNRVPVVDSLVFSKQKINPLSSTEGYQAEFFARDLPGATDYYRIRYYRNGTLQNKPRDIITVKDGSFPGSADTDGLVFIRPFRQSVNPDSLYNLNDTVKVEIMSLTPEAFEFWQQLQNQITNGGLFATPPANVPTNIINTNGNGRRATGFFIASAVRGRTARVAGENLRTK
ncbi:DUF4249 domain-containing protein [Spirosoma taeanense]|uniref:DUF4249 domain-containing protein n=1 Tax=Spirosoma taeanense TaxID=2735870 RepID=A0A6M5YFG7_9BACT|nr:DUF4249 domain-containing protein [Spirosoma taeanense]QJW92013.1 DUF4249 domain-containing protein [Spirosoma taeanense]